MIIQCDQCNTKFRLDDAKVPDKGVKVRCAKCKNIFLVQKEAPAEETDFDTLLSGLGAQASEGERGMPDQKGAAPPEEGGMEGEVTAKPPETWEKEPEEKPVESAEQHAGRDDFGDDFFSFREEPAVSEGEGSERGEYQFGETTAGFEEEGATEEEAGGENKEFDFGDYSTEEETGVPQTTVSEPPTGTSAETDEFDFGSFDVGPEGSTIADEAGTTGATAGEPAAEGIAFGEVEAPPAEEREEVKWSELESEKSGDFIFSTTPVPQTEEEVEAATVPVEVASDVPVAPVPSDIWAATAKEPEAAAGEAPPESDAAAATPEPVTGTEPVVPFGSPIPAAEEELPPLAISTRKKGNSALPVAVTAIAVLIVLAVAGLGFYVFKEGPAAFDKLGLSFLAKWIGIESVDVGNIAVKNQQGAFMVNGEAGEIFVVSGEVVNNYKEPRSSIQVKATVLGPKGEALMQKTAYCGDFLTRDQLTTLPMNKIEEAMASPFGDTLDNLGVPPGKGIPFVIVLSKVPNEAREFSVEVVGSTVATP